MPTPASSTYSLPASKDSGSVDTEAETLAEPISVPDTGEHGEGGKLKMIVQLVKRALGVKDIAAMRLSLPASLLEPIPNLEYWNYLDRPDLFAAINDPDDQFQRMLAVIRFTFSKELKFVKGKVCKPYNSVLGEHFRAYNDVPTHAVLIPISDLAPAPILSWHLDDSGPQPPVVAVNPHLKSPSSASLSVRSINQPGLLGDHVYAESSPNLVVGGGSIASSEAPSIHEYVPTPGAPHHRVIYLTEQVSHHPPISSFWIGCPSKGIEGRGVDQISARIAGTTLKVASGSFNKGIFLEIKSGNGAGEAYRITHPVACVNGVLRGSMYATISESTIITSTSPNGQHMRAILEYKEESWIGAPKFLVEGVVFQFNPEAAEQETWTKVKQVPKDLILATLDGSWRKEIRWKTPDAKSSNVLLDLSLLSVVPKTVRPLSEQLPNESRKLWESVSSNLLKKEYSEANKIKQQIEQRQRDLAAERKKNNTPFVPVYFEGDLTSGAPELTEEGKRVIEEIMKV